MNPAFAVFVLGLALCGSFADSAFAETFVCRSPEHLTCTIVREGRDAWNVKVADAGGEFFTRGKCTLGAGRFFAGQMTMGSVQNASERFLRCETYGSRMGRRGRYVRTANSLPPVLCDQMGYVECEAPGWSMVR